MLIKFNIKHEVYNELFEILYTKYQNNQLLQYLPNYYISDKKIIIISKNVV